jgi:hypothetical protein
VRIGRRGKMRRFKEGNERRRSIVILLRRSSIFRRWGKIGKLEQERGEERGENHRMRTREGLKPSNEKNGPNHQMRRMVQTIE